MSLGVQVLANYTAQVARPAAAYVGTATVGYVVGDKITKVLEYRTGLLYFWVEGKGRLVLTPAPGDLQTVQGLVPFGTGPQGEPGPAGPGVDIEQLREEFEMLGTPYSASGVMGGGATISLPAPGSGQQWAILNTISSYTRNARDVYLTGLLTVSSDGGATFKHRGAITQSGGDSVPQGALMGGNNSVQISMSGVVGSIAHLNVVAKIVAV